MMQMVPVHKTYFAKQKYTIILTKIPTYYSTAAIAIH